MEIQQLNHQFALNKDVFCLLNIYKFLCKHAINRNFIITANEILLIRTYVNNPFVFKKKSNNFWDEYSIQREIFEATILFFLNIKELNYLTFHENFLLILNNNNFSNFIIKIFSKNLKTIYHIYLNSLYIDLNKHYHSFKDTNFEFYLITTSDNNFSESSYFIDDCISFRFVLEGSVRYKKNIFASKGDLIICDQGFYLEEYTVLTPIYSEIILILKPNFINSLNLDIPRFNFQKLSFCFNKKLLMFILNEEPITPQNYFNLQILAIYGINLILNENTEVLDKNIITLKNEILTIISKNIQYFDSEIIIILINSLNFSPSKLYQLFKEIFNSTPTKVIQTIKINHACFLIISTENTFEQISTLIGYDESTFYRKFKNIINSSPSMFKKQKKLTTEEIIKYAKYL